MANKLFIRFFENDFENVEWISVTDDINLPSPQKDRLSELPPTAADTLLIVLVPTAQVLLMQVELPKMSRARLLQAVPFALEDQLSTDIETLHFVIGSRDNSHINVAVVEQQLMQQWLQVMQAVELYPQVMIPDALALPFLPETWTCGIEKNNVLIRNGLQQCCSIDKLNFETFLQYLLDAEADKKPKKLIVEDYVASANLNLQSSLAHILDIEIIQHPISLLASANDTLDHSSGMNLLQGNFKPIRKSSQLKSQWELAKWLALTWLIVLVIGSFAQYLYLHAQAAKLSTQVDALYQQALPGIPIVSATETKSQLEHELQELRTAANGGPFLNLLGKAGSVLHAHNNIKILQMNFQNNKLTINLILKSFADLEQINSELEAQGLRVKQNNVVSQGNTVSAQLVVRGIS